MKRLTMLVKALLQDAALDLDLSVERDAQRIVRRCEHEGFSFLAITLPTLSDALEQGLESGSFTCPTAFSRHGSLPRFLGGFFKRVFTLDGRLRQDACPNSVYWIRQICRFCKKPKKECSPARNRAAIQHFLDVEGDLRRATPLVEREDNVLDSVSGLIWPRVFPGLDGLDLVCHHGPGVTADRRLSNERHRIKHWHERSEFSYPSDLHAYPNYGVAARVSGIGTGDESEEGVEYLSVRDELPVRVVFVPKTLTTPRVIAIEPSHVQYMQQSLKDYIYEILERNSLTKHSIRFTRQDVNQRLAYISSIDKRLATLDLKDASDRVHLHLVQRIFKNSGLLEYLEDARSLHATLPNGKNIVLTKYASMGSALCFPVEAMVFYTLILSAMHQLDGRRPTYRSIQAYSRKIDIYGDDIIVPVEYADVVVRYLESYALKVNVSKSFSKGNFRESCGADFYKGMPVNPVYARTVPPDNLRHWGAEEILSWNATADLFYMRGKWKTAQAIRTLLSRVVRRTIPKTSKPGSGLAHFSFIFTTDLRWNRDLQCWKQKRLHFDPIKQKDEIDGDELACLNKWGQHVHAQKRTEYSNGTCTTEYRYGNGTLYQGHRKELYAFPEWGSVQFGIRCSDIGCRAGPQVPHDRPSVGDISIRGVPYHYGWTWTELPSIQPVVGTCDADGARLLGDSAGARPEERVPADYCLTETLSDPLLYLHGSSEGIDFLSSTKRGCFKSKSRWVSLAG